MRHGTLTLVTPVRPGAVEDVRALLHAWDEVLQAQRPHPLREIEALYFAHWGLTGEGAQGEECLLIFGADLRLSSSLRGRQQIRAAVEVLVDALTAPRARSAERAFDALYAHCEGYPAAGLAEPERVKEYLCAHASPYSTRHVDFAYRIASPSELREVLALRARAETYLNDSHRRPFLERLDIASLHEALHTHLGALLTRLTTAEWLQSQADALLEAALATLSYLLVEDPLRLLVQLKERLASPRPTPSRPPVPDAQRARIEARQQPVQNSMILLADVPTHWMGQLQQRLFMALVDWRLKRNLVGMNDVRTIHFARWALIPRGAKQQLLFIVTYDQSWDAYIDEFVNNQDVGTFLKLIWGEDPGFPSGQPFVEPFKEWIRSVQCPTQVHYSALLHGAAPPASVAVTDLHEALALCRVLCVEDVRSPEAAQTLQDLEAFVAQGRFPYQEKQLRPRQAAGVLRDRLSAALHRHLDTSPRRISHVAAPHPRPVSGEAGRRAGNHRAWLQAHGDRRLPVVEDQGRRVVQGMASGDPEGAAHDG